MKPYTAEQLTEIGSLMEKLPSGVSIRHTKRGWRVSIQTNETTWVATFIERKEPLSMLRDLHEGLSDGSFKPFSTEMKMFGIPL